MIVYIKENKKLKTKKREVLIMKKIEKVLFMLILMFAFTMTVKADDEFHSITITKQIVHADTAVSNSYHYTLTPINCNTLEGVQNCVTYGGQAKNYTLNVTTSNTPNAEGEIVVSATWNLESLAEGGSDGSYFATLGDYYFELKETESNKTYRIAVLSRMNSSNSPSQFWTIMQQGAADDGKKGPYEFVDQPTASLTLSKTVSGDLGNQNEDFNFEVEIKDYDGNAITESRTLTLSGDASGTQTISSSNNKVTVTLKHGETATISGLDSGWKYKVTELGATNYKTYIDSSTTDSKVTAQKTLSNDASKNSVSYQNVRESVSPTGIILNILPFIGLIFIAVGSGLLIRKKVNA